MRATLRTADTEWIQLIIELTGTDVAHAQPSDIRRIRDVVFGRTLGHISADAIATAAATAGLATAFRALAAVASENKLDMTPWAKPLGIPLLAAPGPDGITQATITTIAGALTDAATSAKTAYEAALAGDANADGAYGNDVCLWVEALTAPGPLHAAIKSAGGPLGVPALRSAAVQFALARIVGVPVWQALGGVVPIDRVACATACGLCQAASSTNAVAHVQRTSALVGNTASHACTLSPSHGINGQIDRVVPPTRSIRHDWRSHRCVRSREQSREQQDETRHVRPWRSRTRDRVRHLRGVSRSASLPDGRTAGSTIRQTTAS
mgnify:CR=1 FL=1